MNLLRLLPAELDALVVEAGHPRYRADQFLDALYRGSADSLDGVRQWPADLRASLKALGWEIELPRLCRATESDDGDTQKVLLELGGGTLVEAVLMRYSRTQGLPRATVCVSTQAGCAMGCVFCATGQMGFERNLYAEEVVAQVLHFARALRGTGERLANVVFMGMGEPLANYAETIRAVRLLVDRRALGLAQRAITISTVGIVGGIDRLAAEGLQVNLAISLHAADNALRRRLVPTAGPASVEALLEAAARYRERTGRRVSFEYALIEGLNDGLGEARLLARRLRGSDAHVNVIPVNATAGGFRRPSPVRLAAFCRALRDGGVNCTVRAEKGAEIAAACGQLRTGETGGTGSESMVQRGRPRPAAAR